MLHILEKYKHFKTKVLVGHSYGGTLAARILMIRPEFVDETLLVGAAVDPENEKIFLISYPAEWALFRSLVPASFRVANIEKMNHVSELLKIMPDWLKITKPMTVIHGSKDRLVPVENAFFIEREARNSEIEMNIYEKEGHLIPFTKPEIIKTTILRKINGHAMSNNIIK